jgi:hypothetical protein
MLAGGIQTASDTGAVISAFERAAWPFRSETEEFRPSREAVLRHLGMPFRETGRSGFRTDRLTASDNEVRMKAQNMACIFTGTSHHDTSWVCRTVGDHPTKVAFS